MTNTEALKALSEGYRIRHVKWLKDYNLFFDRTKDKVVGCIKSEENVECNADLNHLLWCPDNWEIYKLNDDSIDALKAFKKGKKIRQPGWPEKSFLKMDDVYRVDYLLNSEWIIVDG